MTTKKQQVGEVVQGLGLGLLALGVSRVTAYKLDLEFAFSHAWRKWDHARDYPAIGRAPKPDNEFWIGVGDSATRTRAAVKWFDDVVEYEIRINYGGETPEAVAGLVSDLPLGDWINLAREFRDALGDEDNA